MKKIAVLAILLTSFSIGAGQALAKKPVAKSKTIDVQKAPGWKVAMENFKDHHYGPAATELETLDKTGYCCDTLHYYLAQCYQNNNQLNLAKTHYAWILTYSKNPTLISYANTALGQLDYYGGHRTYKGQGNAFDRGSKPQKRRR